MILIKKEVKGISILYHYLINKDGNIYKILVKNSHNKINTYFFINEEEYNKKYKKPIQ